MAALGQNRIPVIEPDPIFGDPIFGYRAQVHLLREKVNLTPTFVRISEDGPIVHIGGKGGGGN
jgi:hypothetical protein